jgi:hypothetical protein
VAKSSGLGAQLYIAGYDLSGDVGAIGSINDSGELLDVTGLDKSAPERIPGIADGEINFTSYFNDAALQAHVALRALGSGANRHVMVASGTSIGDGNWFLTAKQISYDGTRGADGSFVFEVGCQASAGVGLEGGHLLTAGKRTDTGATNGASFDGGAASAAGISAQLQVFSFTGTSVTVTIQESSDDAVGDPFAAVTGGAFTAATGQTTERIETAAISVERYLRIATSGTFSSAVFAVSVKRL